MAMDEDLWEEVAADRGWRRPLYPHGLYVARIETLKNLSAFRRRTCAGDGPRFVSAALELHCTSAAGVQ